MVTLSRTIFGFLSLAALASGSGVAWGFAAAVGVCAATLGLAGLVLAVTGAAALAVAVLLAAAPSGICGASARFAATARFFVEVVEVAAFFAGALTAGDSWVAMDVFPSDAMG
jgi:hypothetical protein